MTKLVSRMSGFVARLRALAARGSVATEARALDDALTTSMALVRALRAHAEPARSAAGPGLDDHAYDARASDAICIELRGTAAASRVALAVSALAEALRGSVEIGSRAGGRAAIVLEDAGGDEITVHASFYPQLEDLGGGEVAATPAQATALELLEQLAGGDEDEDHEGHDH